MADQLMNGVYFTNVNWLDTKGSFYQSFPRISKELNADRFCQMENRDDQNNELNDANHLTWWYWNTKAIIPHDKTWWAYNHT